MLGKIDRRAVMKGVIVFTGLLLAYILLGFVFTTVAKQLGEKSGTLGVVLTFSERLLWIVSVMVPGAVAGRVAGKHFFLHGALVGIIGSVISVLFLLLWSLATGARFPMDSSLLVKFLVTVFLCGFGGMVSERRGDQATPSPSPREAEEEGEPTGSREGSEEEALYHSGVTFFEQAQTTSNEEAQTLYQAACEAFRAASAINSNNPRIMNDWGVALMEQAGLVTGEAAEALYEQAREKFLAAEALQPGIASYNLACIHSRRGEYEECRKRLGSARNHKSLPSLEHLKNDADLANVRQLKWFNKFIKTIRADQLPPA
jgi:putative membrane protein (TIGR04086 family)